MNEEKATARWLLLMYQFPKGPDSRRVRIWRRLRGIGAVAIKNSVYILPLNDQSQEDFAWLLEELRSSGADGAILESRFVDGMSDEQIRVLFNEARSADYQELQNEIEATIVALPTDKNNEDDEAMEYGRRAHTRALKRISEIEAIDYFNADGRDSVARAMHILLSRTTHSIDDAMEEEAVTATALQDLAGQVWVTRRGVRVDRIASAWLIRRWIDAEATFKFVSGNGYERGNNEVRFDMFEAEYTHEGDSCTFEVMSRLVAEQDVALRNIAEIIHDIDLKDGKFGRPETEGVANILSGIVAGTDDDDERVEQGSALFENLYRFFSNVEK